MSEPSARNDSKPIVLVENDTVHAALLDDIAESLQARQYAVHRGGAAAAAAGRLGRSVEIVVTTSRGRLDAPTMAALNRLHTIVVPTTGVESIAVDAATDMGIAVANGATLQNVISMPEATAMLLLALMYRLRAVAMGWRDQSAAGQATLLRGKTVGLIGYGGVARELVPRLRAFGTTVLIRSSRHGLQAEGATFVSLQELLERSDAICLLGAFTEGTRHLLGRDEIARMKRTAFVVNTARGGLIDEAALCEALSTGRLAGAALDTFQEEPLPPSSPLRSLSNVVLTPHCVGHTRELSSAMLPTLVDNIEAARTGELPPYCKNPEVRDRWRRHQPQT